MSLQVLGLQSQLLGLGVSSAKAALDTLLAGYYSVAFAAIRHMLEIFAQYLYVGVEPDEAKLWYEQPGGLVAQEDPPSMLNMAQSLKAHPSIRGTAVSDLIDKVYASWKLMSKGSHPSGEGITQTLGEGSERFTIGATYHPGVCLVGFDHGLFAMVLLLPGALAELRPQNEAWLAEWERVRRDISAWRDAHASEIEAIEGQLPSDPTGVPAPTKEDAKRARRIIAGWEASMNAMELRPRSATSTSEPCVLRAAVSETQSRL